MEVTITDSLLAIALGTPMDRGGNVPFLFWGTPGMGKTSQVEDTLDAMGWARMTLSPDHDETSYGLVPAIDHEKRRTTSYPYVWIDDLNRTPRSAVIIDDLTASTRLVHAAQLRLLTHRTTASIALPPRCAVIGLSNRPDEATNGHRLSPATASRFVHVVVRRSLQESAAHLLRTSAAPGNSAADLLAQIDRGFARALAQERPKVAGFVLARSVLGVADQRDDLDIVVTANDRTLDYMARAVAAARCIGATQLIPALVAGSIGRGHAAAYVDYCEKQNLPSDEEVLCGWRPKPSDADILFVVVLRLAQRVAAGEVPAELGQRTFWDLCTATSAAGLPADLVIPAVRVLYRAGIYPPARPEVNALLNGIILG